MGAEGEHEGLNLRVSDTDREDTVAALRTHLQDGRLTLDEFSTRLSEAYASKTEAELRTVLRDLPTVPQRAPSPSPYEARQRRLQKLRNDFLGFLTPNVTCVGIWAMTGHGYFWPGWVLFGTGLAFLGRLRHDAGSSPETDTTDSTAAVAVDPLGGIPVVRVQRRPGEPETERTVATVVFADVVNSTERLAELGDGQWQGVVDTLERRVGEALPRFGGRMLFTRGDEVVAAFSAPARAVECAYEMQAIAEDLGLQLRTGVHAGEVTRRGEDMTGIALHIGKRVCTEAEPGEVLVSSTVRDLTVGSRISYVDRGEHELRGVPGPWRLYSVHDV
ncbi:MAG TPA: DUF1707 domain-containing protein [Acidimicrobiales bacterium]|nr:DUF1707 domain-containing protein [Acidimicrobiales bacterium]